MHVLIPVFFNAPLGGLHDNVLSTAMYCKQKFYDVTIICKPGPFQERVEAEGIKVITTNFSLLDYRRVIENVITLHNENPIDLIHTHPFESRKLSLFISTILNIPVFLTIHGRYTDQLNTYIDNISLVFCVSEGIKDFLFQTIQIKDKHKFFVIPNGVNQEIFKPKEDLFQQQNDKLNISLITRLDQDKEFIIDIFYKALQFTYHNFNSKVKWTIVGDGTLRNQIEHEAKKFSNTQHQVTFVGWKEGQELLQQYKESDILLAPGRCALEGMSCGVPVIAIGSKGYIGLIREENWLEGVYSNFGGIGNKIEDYSEGTIEKELQLLIEDVQLRKKLSTLGTKITNQFYDENKINENLVQFYEMFKKNQKDQVKTSYYLSILDQSIQTRIRGYELKQISECKYQIELIFNKYDDLQFAWYILEGGDIVEKFFYSNSNVFQYTFLCEGVYKIKCYIRNDEETMSFQTEEIMIEK